MIVESIKALADVLGCSHEAIRQWQREGLPCLERGAGTRGSRFDTAAAHAWLVDRAVRKAVGETPRDRLARVQADSVELDLAAKRKLMIPVHLIEPKWAAACIAAREQLLRSRRLLARKLGSAKDEQARDRIIGQVHEQFLRTLADWRGENAPAAPAKKARRA